MSWDSAIGELDKQLPDFNDYLLVGYPNEQINNIPDYVECVFKEVTKQFNGQLKYLGREQLPPDARVRYNTGTAATGAKKRKNILSVTRSELVLMRYAFDFQGMPIYIHLYVPFMYDNAIILYDTEYRLLNNIVERVISRSDDGVVIKVMRSPLRFWRKLRHRYVSTSGSIHYDSIITCCIYYEKNTTNTSKISKRTPLVLYFLARYGLQHVVTNLFEIPAEQLTLVDSVDESEYDEFEYFKLGESVYLKVSKEVMQDIDKRRLVASIIYIVDMRATTRFRLSDLYSDQFYKIILGKNLRGANKNDALACSDVQQHMESLSTYIDAYSRRELESMNIACGDIYELLLTVFMSIDSWIERYSPNNLFDKRIASIDYLLKYFVTTVYHKAYKINRKNKPLTLKDVGQFRIDPFILTNMVHARVPFMRQSSDTYNDNEVMSSLINRSRRDSASNNSGGGNKTQEELIHAPEYKLHISMIATESALAISSSKPCATGDMNPYAVIDSTGRFRPDQMPWIEDLYPLERYLNRV